MSNKSEALETLLELLPVGTRIYTIVRSVSQSGMSRHISALVIKDGELRDITHLLERAGFGKHRAGKPGLYITGVNMDMCFKLVYDVSRTLYDDGDAISYETI